MCMLNSFAIAGDIDDINIMISKYGKYKIINYILHHRGAIFVKYNGIIKEMIGPPSEEYVDVDTFINPAT